MEWVVEGDGRGWEGDGKGMRRGWEAVENAKIQL